MKRINVAAISTVCLIVAALFCLGAGIYGAWPKEYVTTQAVHTVAPGQTLWGIAYKYKEDQNKYSDIREFVYSIRQANGWKLGEKQVIIPGEKIIIPLENEKK